MDMTHALRQVCVFCDVYGHSKLRHLNFINLTIFSVFRQLTLVLNMVKLKRRYSVQDLI